MNPRLSFKILSVALGLLLLLVLDFGIRQAYVVVWRKLFPETPRLRVRDDFFHHGFRPNWSASDKFGPYTNLYFINSLGLRDAKVREVSVRKTKPPILFVGDSFTEGVGVPWEKTFVGRVARALEPQGVEVLNAGVAAYCPVIEKVKLRTLLRDQGLEVDRVVVFIDIADIGDELYYEETAEGKIRQTPWGPFHEKAEDLKKFHRTSQWLEQNVEKNFVVLGAVLRNLRQKKEHQVSMSVTFLPGPEWPDYDGELREFVEQGLREAKASMSDLAKLVRAQGALLTVAVYPWPPQIRAGTRPSRAEVEWSEWAKDNGAEFINLFPLFVSGAPPEEVVAQYYIPGDCHWNENGHALVAQELLRRSELLLPSPAKPQRPLH